MNCLQEADFRLQTLYHRVRQRGLILPHTLAPLTSEVTRHRTAAVS